ncbi:MULTISPECIES: DUF6332 family protein [Streptomyces]|uniref:Uncharacterized protein n=1 Tax=Streptomyces qinglanensis TaxID=943816 RepID=A0A1E7K5U5_9ACTN|nr:DUF6332 family protein [Streptomyces qinglanensis]MBE9500018.1 hypothetical protein [Streptomyces sp. GKU 257-1]OEU99279.1 hypothetical protein AN217_17330 [Streptomyces qinglanensis]
MDMGREARWEKDAMTVEIVFALVTAVVLGGVVFTVAWTSVLALDLSGLAERRVLMVGAVLGAVAGVWRLVRVLLRFDRQRRMGH